MDLMKAVECSLEGPIKTDLMKTAGSNIVLVCLETGQEIPPHPEPYSVVFVVLRERGLLLQERLSTLSDRCTLFL
jgi:hypothetical protein